jgi:hypothetical protein
MTEPTPSQTALDAYAAANAGRYTEEALYSTLVAAGYPADDVRVALASAAANLQPRRTRPRAVQTILIAYVAVFALLSAGMLLNHRTGGYLMPNAGGGIGILATSLGVCFVASLIWVASRRLFVILLLISIALYGFGALTSGGSGSLISLVIVAFAIGGVVVLLRRPRPAGTIGEPELALLLVLPVILLLGVAGICVASGLPIPGTS